jgi:hypothetical protein
MISSLYEDTQDEATLEEIFPPDTTVGNYCQIERNMKHQRRLKEDYVVRGANLESELKQHGKGCLLSPFIDDHTDNVQRNRAKSSPVTIYLSRTNSAPFGGLPKDTISNFKSCETSKP